MQCLKKTLLFLKIENDAFEHVERRILLLQTNSPTQEHDRLADRLPDKDGQRGGTVLADVWRGNATKAVRLSVFFFSF